MPNDEAGSLCAQCGEPLDEQAKFCANCGTAVVRDPIEEAPADPGSSDDGGAAVAASVVCPECGAEVAPGLRFCTKCGGSVAAEDGANAPEASSGAPSDNASTPSGVDESEKIDSSPVQAAGTPDQESKGAYGAIIAAGVVAAIVVVILVIVLVAGGGDDSDSAASQTRPRKQAPTTTAAPTTTTLPPTSFGYQISGTDSRGYSQQATVHFGPPEHADPKATGNAFDPVTSEYEKLLKACPVTKSTDAMVPVTVTLKNTTANFSEFLGIILSSETDQDSLQVASDEEYSTGPLCTTPSSSNNYKLYGIKLNDKTKPQETEKFAFYLIIYDYYTPDLPAGDESAYRALLIEPQLTFGPEGDTRYVTDPLVTFDGDLSVPQPEIVG